MTLYLLYPLQIKESGSWKVPIYLKFLENALCTTISTLFSILTGMQNNKGLRMRKSTRKSCGEMELKGKLILVQKFKIHSYEMTSLMENAS